MIAIPSLGSPRKKDGETPEKFAIRTSKLVKIWKDRANLEPWSDRYFQQVYRWGSKVEKLAKAGSARAKEQDAAAEHCAENLMIRFKAMGSKAKQVKKSG